MPGSAKKIKLFFIHLYLIRIAGTICCNSILYNNILRQTIYIFYIVCRYFFIPVLPNASLNVPVPD